MKNFTLTLLTFLLLHWSTLHKASCTSPVIHSNNNNHHGREPLSENLLKADATNATVGDGNNSTDHNSSVSSSSTSIVNEKKSQRDQRTLYRKAGGHLRSEVSSTTTESPTTILNQSVVESSSIASREVIYPVNSSKLKSHKSYFRRKTKTPLSQNVTLKNNRDVSASGSSNNNKVINVKILDSSNSKETTNDDENSLDYGLMKLSAAGEGNRNRTNDDDDENSKGKKDESKKTLSDQIAEGKYGLIEKEIFTKRPKAPGIISYKTNPETPNDNEKTLGGLSKDEIWLAEDHLLVLKGGITNDKKNNQNEENWSPIDDYEAPKRPVKIPINPKVPPPFPIQLTENGPLQFIGHNKFSLFNPYTNETNLFANVDGHIKTDFDKTNYHNEKDFIAGFGKAKNFTKDEVHEVIPPPPWLFQNNYKDADLLKHFPFNLPLPDQASNFTDDFDEDDPSLFYPPPYSFVYKTNYTNLAPVGPLVPGIILPPPPDFFSVYNPEEEKTPIKTPLDAYKRIKEIQLKNRLTASTTTSIPPRSTTFSSAYIRDFTRKTKPPTTTTISSVSTIKQLHKTKTTTLRPTTTQPTTISYSSTPKELLNYKTLHNFDTTTLRLHPVYVPSSVTTKLYSTISTTTTPLPPSSQLPQFQQPQQQHVKQYQKYYGTQAHPIYFEYFDARTANPLPPINHPFVGPEYETSYINSHQQSTSTSSTQAPPQIIYSQQQQPTKVHKKPKSFYPPQFISTTISPANVDAKFLFVTPKPEVYGSILAPQSFPVSTDTPISYNTAIPIQKPLVLKPVGKFEDEIAAIKHTLNYYGSGSSNKHVQKPSKVKAVYEFSFEASKHKNQQQQEDFKPMLSYDQKNAHISELIKTNSYFPTSTEPTMKYYRTKQSATLPPKKIVHPPPLDTNMAPPSMAYGQKLRQQNLNYYVRPVAYKEIVTSPQQQQQSQKIIIYPSHDIQSSQSSVDQNGYRVNSKNIKYRNQQQQQYYGPASEVASLLNDTLVNYKQPQRPINPFSEFIDVSRFPQQNSPSHVRPVPPQNNPPYHIYPQQPQHFPQQPIYPNPFQQHRPQISHHQQQQQQHYQHPSLDVVKFEYPLIPQINPESVHITFYNRPMEKSDGQK
ncbi:hypothetical protein PVAND_012239 [Polypedilum vanderplanki]|uniref:Uncharacterized protein n=1 Tax=Polypedilum vanderplanki TaxID=319348 RepID=A0A9J6CKZ8_POLVA|nr:hypothetical protein PVAND_012239 [Polypedilum vanderplanki]